MPIATTMEGPSSSRTVPRGTRWIGRVVSAIPVVMMGLGGVLKVAGGEQMLTGWTSFGYPASTLLPIGLTEVACAILYAIPRTSVLGAILVTGFLGGAVATHARMLQPVFAVPALVGALAWLGLYLREPRLRALLPLRRRTDAG